MNAILKTVLQSVETIAASQVPGGVIVDSAVHKIIQHKSDHAAQISDGLDAAEGAIQVIEAIKGVDIADKVQFRAGCALMEQGAQMVRKALRPTHPPTA